MLVLECLVKTFHSAQKLIDTQLQLADLAEADKIDFEAFTRQVAEHMDRLEVSEFRDFVYVGSNLTFPARLKLTRPQAILNERPRTKLRVLIRYLERFSAAPPLTSIANAEKSIVAEAPLDPAPPPCKPLLASHDVGNGIRPSPIKSAEKQSKRISGSIKTDSFAKPLYADSQKLLSRIPYELEPTAEQPRPLKRIPKRAFDASTSAGIGSPTSLGMQASAVNAVLKFGVVKLELLRLFVYSAKSEEVLDGWKAARNSGALLDVLRIGRSRLAINGGIPKQVIDLEKVEHVILQALF